jgi:hypothetical protein
MRRSDGPRDDPAGANVVLNENIVQAPGCALVEARMLEAGRPAEPEVVTALARPLGIDPGYYCFAAISASHYI